MLLALRCHPAYHDGVRSSENNPKGDTGCTDSIPAATLRCYPTVRQPRLSRSCCGSFGLFCITSQEDWVGPLCLRLCTIPRRLTQTHNIHAFSHLNSQAHALTSSYAHCCWARVCFMFVCGSSHSHTHTRVWNPVELLQQWKLAGLYKGSEFYCKLQLLANQGLWWIWMLPVFTHTCSPTEERRRLSHFVTPQGTPLFYRLPLPVWGIDEVGPLSEFAVISPGS